MSNPWDPNSGQPPAAPPPGSTPPPETPPPPGVPTAPQYPAPEYPAQGAPGVPPAAPPGAVPPPGHYPPAPPAPNGGGKGGKGGKIAAGVAGVLLLGGAGAFALTSMGGDGGPSTAEDAVEEVLEALADEDVLGLLGAIDPGERDALRDNIEDLLGHLERIDVLDDSFEADGIDGIDIDIDFDTVEYETEEIREGLTRVHIVDGDIDFSFDPREAPLGDLVTDFVGDIDLENGSGSISFSDLDEGIFLVARDTGDDGWRVSVGYTIAEIVRFESGSPELRRGIDAIGEDSPEEAVEGFLRVFEGDAVDMEEFVARLSPSELGALQEYLPTFLGRIDEVEYYDFEFSLDDIELSAETSGNTALVTIDSFSASLSDTEGDESVTFEYDGDCLTVDTSDSLSFEEQLDGTPFEDEVCGGDPIGIIEDLGSSVADAPDVDLDFGPFGLKTARVDGKWYIAPVDTALTNLNTILEPIDRDDIEEIIEFGGSLFDSYFTAGFGGIDLPGPTPTTPPTTSTTTTTTTPPDGPDYGAVTPDPALGLTDDQLEQIEGIAEYISVDPAEALCAYELIVTGVVPYEELLRSWAEDDSPSPEAQEHLANIESVCI